MGSSNGPGDISSLQFSKGFHVSTIRFPEQIAIELWL